MITRSPIKGVNLSIDLKDVEKRPYSTLLQGNDFIKVPIYTGADGPIGGDLVITLPEGVVLEHKGIWIEVYGRLEIKKNDTYFYFLRRRIELVKFGTLSQSWKFWFVFDDFPKQPESCYGITANVRYFFKATVHKTGGSEMTLEQDFIVSNPLARQAGNIINDINIGQQDKILITYRHDKVAYHLKDVINSKLAINSNGKKVKQLTVTFLRKEKLVSATDLASFNGKMEEEIITKFDLTEECPKDGSNKTIAFSLPLSCYKLTPTYLFQTQQAIFAIYYYLGINVVGEDKFNAYEEVRITLIKK